MGIGPAGVSARIGLTLTNPNSTAPPVDPATGDTLVDPSAITVNVKDPTGAVTVYTLAGGQVLKDSIGIYHVLVDTTGKPGHWVVEGWGPQPVQFDSLGAFDVDDNPFR